MREALENIQSSALEAINNADDFEQLEKLKVQFLGKKGELTAILKGLGKLLPEERPLIGQLANQVKNCISLSIDERTQKLKRKILEEKIQKERIDITLPGRKPETGRIHPIAKILREIKDVFIGLGFKVVEGPEVETEFYNFEALNIPADHPARENWDSFYFKRGLLLRSHTSPVQVRIMEKQPPPVKIIVPGRCFRRDTVDATHHWMFQQVEGLLIDEKVTFAHLKGTLIEFARQIFGKERKARFFPSYFPFTEPSADMQIDCFACKGAGCKICKFSGWIEILGSGMVNPKVLKIAGYDPEKYSGFAFGMGPDRIAMLKYGINDIRLFYENDLRFLEQF